MKRSRVVPFILGAFAMLWGGCDPKETIKNFPHKPHIEAELACTFCHEMGEKTVGFPKMEVCASCHDLADEEVFKECNSCHGKHSVTWKEDSLVNHRVLFEKIAPDSYRDLQYNHAEYLEKDMDCLQCHTSIKESERSSLENIPKMKLAMDVQKKLGKSNECSVCHEKLDIATPPDNHTKNWKETHGRMTEFTGTDACVICHREDTCKVCHATEKPKSHTNLFRRETHGIQASFNRAKCLVCHRSDECESCHQSAANPIPAEVFHTPDASCLTCHSPLAAQGPDPRPPQRFFKPMPHRMMMGATSQKCLTCHQF